MAIAALALRALGGGSLKKFVGKIGAKALASPAARFVGGVAGFEAVSAGLKGGAKLTAKVGSAITGGGGSAPRKKNVSYYKRGTALAKAQKEYMKARRALQRYRRGW